MTTTEPSMSHWQHGGALHHLLPYACLHCRAAPGEPCRTPDGRRTLSHSPRVALWALSTGAGDYISWDAGAPDTGRTVARHRHPRTRH